MQTLADLVRLLLVVSVSGRLVGCSTELLTGSVLAEDFPAPLTATAVPIMLDVLQRCFPDKYPGWLPELKALIPTIGTTLNGSPAKAKKVMQSTAAALDLTL